MSETRIEQTEGAPPPLDSGPSEPGEMRFDESTTATSVAVPAPCYYHSGASCDTTAVKPLSDRRTPLGTPYSAIARC